MNKYEYQSVSKRIKILFCFVEYKYSNLVTIDSAFTIGIYFNIYSFTLEL